MPNIQDLPLEIQQMIVRHAMYMPEYILYKTPSEVQQVYPIRLQLKIVDNQVILHCISEFNKGKELEYFKMANAKQPFVVTSAPKRRGICETEEGQYQIRYGEVTTYHDNDYLRIGDEEFNKSCNDYLYS